jgi:hypothetical protein
MNEDRLSPCPFRLCQGPAKLIEIEIEDIDSNMHRAHRVICTRCGSQGPIGGRGDRGRARAIEMWEAR